MKTKSQYRLAKNYRVGILCFFTLALALEATLLILPKFQNSVLKVEVVPEELQPLLENNETSQKALPQNLTVFNPNDFSEEDWKELGLSERQIQTLFKYKNIIGGFKTKAQFKKCYAISDEFYVQIAPYLDLPNDFPKREYNSFTQNKFEPKNVQYRKFDPNTYDLNDWMSIGFSEKQAQSILNYKNKFLKGSFQKVEDLQQCFVISEEKYAEMKPYMFISKSNITTDTKPDFSAIKPEAPKTTKPIVELKPFNINDLDEQDWQELGFTPKQVSTILKFKKSLGGKYTSLEQFKRCYVVSEEKFEELKPYIRFE